MLFNNGGDFDQDADSAIDCWKNVTASGNYNLSSQQDFGPRSSEHHDGIDIGAALGTAIFSPAFIKITQVEPNGIYNTLENPQSGNGAFVRGEFYSLGVKYQGVLVTMSIWRIRSG